MGWGRGEPGVTGAGLGRGLPGAGRGRGRAQGARGGTARRREAALFSLLPPGAAPPAPPLRAPPPSLGRPESRPPTPRLRTCSNFLGRAGPSRCRRRRRRRRRCRCRCRCRARVSGARSPRWSVGPCPPHCLRPTPPPGALWGLGLLPRFGLWPSGCLASAPEAAPRAALALSVQIAREGLEALAGPRWAELRRRAEREPQRRPAWRWGFCRPRPARVPGRVRAGAARGWESSGREGPDRRRRL